MSLSQWMHEENLVCKKLFYTELAIITFIYEY